jgi:hypothetical protein
MIIFIVVDYVRFSHPASVMQRHLFIQFYSASDEHGLKDETSTVRRVCTHQLEHTCNQSIECGCLMKIRNSAS